jgi:two-component system cell cycle sensor histidine kinase/response regulator CckA
MNTPNSPSAPAPTLPAPSSPEQYLSLVFNSAANMMALFQVEGETALRLISFNRAYLKVIRSAGYPLESSDLIGKTLDDLFSNVFRFERDDRERHFARYHEVIAANQPVYYEEVHDTPNGRYFGETTLSPVSAAGGACAFVLFSSTDVTERRRSEDIRRQLESQLQQAQKLQAIGTLAAGIAHDFNNIITAILGNAQLLQLDLPPGGPLGSCVQHIIDGSHRARDRIQQILTFSRQQRQERREGRLQPVIAAVVSALRGTLARPIEIRTDLLADEPAILMDASQVQQALMNLCVNSAQAMGAAAGTLTLRQTLVAPDQAFRRAHPHAAARQYVRLQIGDTGHGMDASTVQRLFEPFFTTKGPGEGTGLGLAVVHGIVGAHDGAIEVASDPGKGTVFSIFFPALEPIAPPLIPTSTPAGPARRAAGHEHVLFVDDEEAVRQLGKPILERFGYRVTMLADGPSVLELLRQHPGEVDAIVSDLNMPGMTGIELGYAVQRLQPGLPFLVMTGYGDSGHADALTGHQVLAKPFTLDELANAVRTAINRAK